jgi:hypothetical protein
MMQPLLKPTEAAHILGICTKSLQECRRRGLKWVKVSRGAVRYRESDLADYIVANVQCNLERPKSATINKQTLSGVIAFEDLPKQKTRSGRYGKST